MIKSSIDNFKPEQMMNSEQKPIVSTSAQVLPMQCYRQFVSGLLAEVSYQKFVIRKDKWGVMATVYFWEFGKVGIPLFDTEDASNTISDDDMRVVVLHHLKSNFLIAKEEFKNRFSDKVLKYVRGFNLNCL